MRARWLLLTLSLSGAGCDRMVNRLGREPAKACQLGLVEACLRAAVAERDPARQQALLVRGCALGSVAACVDAGAWLFNAAPPQRDRRRAGELFARGCAARIAVGCRNLSVYHNLETHDLAAARAAARRGCTLRDAEACFNAGALAAEDDPVGAREGFTQACALGSVVGCGRLARHRVIHDPPSAQPETVEPLRRACAARDSLSCYVLGVIQRDGVGGPGGPTDLAEAERCFDQSCAADMPDGCLNLGQLRFRSATTQAGRVAAVVHTDRACALGQMRACGGLGADLTLGRDLPRDLARGERMLLRACDGAFGESCWLLGTLVREGTLPGGEARAAALLRRGCAAGETRACEAAAPAGVDAVAVSEAPRSRRHRRRHRRDGG